VDDLDALVLARRLFEECHARLRILRGVRARRERRRGGGDGPDREGEPKASVEAGFSRP
jgi:hypothetical protein